MTDFLGAVLSGDSTEQAEVETGVEAASPAVEQEEHTEQSGQVEQAEQAKPQEDPVGRKVKGLEAAAAAERRKRQELESRYAQLQSEVQRYIESAQPQKPQPKQDDGLRRPSRDDFDSVEAYEDALLEYGDARREMRAQREAAERQEREAREQFARTADEVVNKGREAFEDFDDTINTALGPLLSQQSRQSELFRAALLNGDRSHEVAYYLGKNPAEAQRIYAMQPMQMVRAVSLIEATKLDAPAQIEQPETKLKPVIPKTLTQARDARTGQFQPAKYDGPTPLDAILARKA